MTREANKESKAQKQMHVYLPGAMLEEIERLAKEDDRSVSNYVARLLKKSLMANGKSGG